HELPDTEDGVRELTQGESGDARADAEARAGREGEERPVEVEVLARKAARQRLVVRGGVVRIAGRTADGGGDLVAERDLDAEARADALAVARPDDLLRLVGLVVEALVAVAHVAEHGRAAEPVG